MMLYFFTNILLLSYSNGWEMIKRDYGYFITGPSCGIGTKMKTLDYVPTDLQNHPCSMIPFKKLSTFKDSSTDKANTCTIICRDNLTIV